jgi:hypothetical protein
LTPEAGSLKTEEITDYLTKPRSKGCAAISRIFRGSQQTLSRMWRLKLQRCLMTVPHSVHSDDPSSSGVMWVWIMRVTSCSTTDEKSIMSEKRISFEFKQAI